MSYPKVTDEKFNNVITNKFKSSTVPKQNKSFNKICYPKKYELQPPQKFLPKYINPKSPYNILVYGLIGSGKSCTAVRILQGFRNQLKIMVVVPASLIGNFRGELRSLCAENNYLTDNERKLLKQYHPMSDEYKEIIRKSDERIDKYYTIYSYNKFVQLAEDKKLKLDNTILVIDEIQNMVSDDGKYYKILSDTINKSSSVRVVLLTGTPMFDKPSEIALTMNLLKLPRKLPIGNDFDRIFIEEIKRRDGTIERHAKNLDLFKEMIRGYVSYYKGADPKSFPTLTLKYVKCEMSDFQYRAYATVMGIEERSVQFKNYKKKIRMLNDGNVGELPNNFLIGARVISNIAFPNNDTDESGLTSLSEYKITHHLDEYSTKFSKIIKKIERCHGKVFVYSTFRSYGGLESFINILDKLGYKNYEMYGAGKKRYGIFSGDENLVDKERIKNIYNRDDNIYGDKLKIMLLSPAAREGLSLFNVRQVHILEPYWNFSRIEQILGRAVRYCSHKALPEDQRDVKAYIYLAVHQNEGETVDQYIAKLASNKSKLISEFENALKECAVDCQLFKNINHLGNLQCDK